jgi:hypothetical protein
MFFVNYLRNIRKECRTVYSGVIREVYWPCDNSKSDQKYNPDTEI